MIEPILTLTHRDDANRFHTYIEEILLAEGYPWFRRLDLAASTLTREQLAEVDVVVLSHIQLTEAQIDLLLRYLEQGGRLVALRPPPALARALGLLPDSPVRHGGQVHGRVMMDRWLQLNPACPLAGGVADRDLQFHGAADLYTWSGDPTAVIAALAPFLGQPGPHPAIVATRYGRGRAAVFAYDLATSTVLFHQGRREQSSTGSRPDCDGDANFKPNDLFVGFLDERLALIPQADLHQDLFVRLLAWLTDDQRPLPRLWYFPRGARAVTFFNGDGDAMQAADLRTVIDQAERFGVPFTTYVMQDNYSVLEPAWEAELRARGHGFGQHAWAGPLPSPETMRAQLRHELDTFAARYGHRAVSYRGHCLIWVGWTEMAQYLAENGLRLDTNFMPARYFQAGYLNGSGLPVKFMDEEGQVIDVYEQCTLSGDDTWMTDKCFRPAYAVEECITASRRLLETAVARYHTVYHPYFHPLHTNPAYLYTVPWLTAMLRACQQLGVPAVSDAAWVAFNDARRALRLTDLHVDAGAGCLCFTLAAGPAIDGATIVLPAEHDGRALGRATLDDAPLAVRIEELEGRKQAVLSADFTSGERHRFAVYWEGRACG